MDHATPSHEHLEDDDGFLREMSSWNREVAEDLARRNDLGPLTEDHWTVIEFVKDYFIKTGEGPPIVRICKATGFTSRYVCQMFPCGVAKGAYRLAGLPRPYGCL
jgi:tRNA 2-thiouridine synthesizing protein E